MRKYVRLVTCQIHALPSTRDIPLSAPKIIHCLIESYSFPTFFFFINSSWISRSLLVVNQ